MIALFLGAFVGLRREMDLQKEGSESFVGFRTLPLIVLLGTISTLFPTMPYLPVVCLVGIIGFLLIAYYNGVFKLKLIGLTSEFATLLMFLVGIFVGNGEFIIGIVITVITAVLTGFKNQFHAFAKNISPKEWGGALQLLILSAVVLPFLPKTAIDPWGVIIPFDIWLLVIFISGIGFVGYFFNKYFGSHKSILATSFLGSLVSSTAVTIALAFQTKKNKEVSKNIFILALLIAIGTMLLRVIFEIGVVAGAEVKSVIFVPVSMLTVTVLLVGWSMWKGRDMSNIVELDPEISSPFEIMPALKFGALFVVVLLAVSFAKDYFGDYGVLAIALLSSFVDVDASILSALQAHKVGEISQGITTLAVTLSIVINTFVKVGYIALLARKDVLRSFAWMVVIICLVGIGVYFFL